MGKIKDHHLTLHKEGSDNPAVVEDGDLALEESVEKKLQPPSMYKVLLMNDDYTPMDFVVEILELFFGMTREEATHVMLNVHTKGKGVCGVFTHDIAETKAAQVNQYSQESSHPLLCEIEKAD